MKTTLLIIFIFTFSSGYTQNKWPDPERKNCLFSKNVIAVKTDTLLFDYPSDSIYFDTLFYNELENVRLIAFLPSVNSLIPLIKNGILNGQIFLDAGVTSYTFTDIYDRMGRRFYDKNKILDSWNKEVILLGVEEIESIDPKIRKYKFSCPSPSGSTTSIFYLELTNPTHNSNTRTEDFMNEAYVSCITKWYFEY